MVTTLASHDVATADHDSKTKDVTPTDAPTDASTESVDTTIYPRPGWQAQALCATDPAKGRLFHDIALDYTDDGPDTPVHPDTWEPLTEKEQHQWEQRRKAVEAACKSVCAECPVLQDCRTSSLTQETTGITGGLTEAEREELRERGGLTVTYYRSNLLCTERDSTQHGRVNDQAVAELARVGTPVAVIAEQLKCSPRTIARSLARTRAGNGTSMTTTKDYSEQPSPKRAPQQRKLRDQVKVPDKADQKRPPALGKELTSKYGQFVVGEHSAVIYDVLATAYEKGTHGGWVCYETILEEVTARGAIPEDMALAEFARTNRISELQTGENEAGDKVTVSVTVNVLTPGAQATSLDRRIMMGRRAIVSNILRCAGRSKREKGQDVPPRIEKLDMDGLNAPWYRCTQLMAESWIPVMKSGHAQVKYLQRNVDEALADLAREGCTPEAGAEERDTTGDKSAA